MGDLNAELVLEEQVLAALARGRRDDDPILLIARENVAATLVLLGQISRALPLQRQVHATAVRVYKDESPQLQTNRTALALTLMQAGRPEEALPLLEKVHEVQSDQFPPGDPHRLEATLNLSAVLRTLGKLDRALALGREVLEGYERGATMVHQPLARARVNVANILADLGRTDEAVALHQRAYEEASAALSGDHADLQAYRSDLSNTLRASGKLARAAELQTEALQALERTLPPDHITLQRCRYNLAVIRLELDDVRGAFDLLQIAQDRLAARVSDENADLQSVRVNLASVLKRLGRNAEAERLEASVLATLRRTLPEDSPRRLAVQGNLAATRWALGDRSGALELLEEVAARLLPRLAEQDTARAQTFINLAVFREGTGDIQGALQASERAFAETSRWLHAGHHLRQAAASHWASMLIDSGDAQRSREVLLAAVAGARDNLLSAAVKASWRAQETPGESPPVALSRLLSYGRDLTDPVAIRQDLELVLGLRGIATRQARVRELIESAARSDAGIRELLQASRAAHRRYLQASEEERAAAVHLAELRQRKERTEEALLARVARLPDMAPLVARWSAVDASAGLPKNGALVVTTTYQRFGPRPASADSRPTTRPHAVPWCVAFLVEPGGGVRRFDLGEQEHISVLCRAFARQAGEGRRGESLVDSRPADRTAPGTLATRLAPLLDAIPRDTTTIVVCPDSALASIPWEALPLTEGRFLRQRARVVYVEHPLALKPRPASDAEPSLLAIGGIEYGQFRGDVAAPSSSAASRPAQWPPLPGSRREVEAITAVLTKAHGGSEAACLTGAQATTEALLQHCKERTVLHLATHGFVAPVEEWDLASDAAGSPAGRWDRELLAGIVLADANVAPGHGRGILSGAQIAGLDLSRCQLAVLSACQTNVGPRQFGEGVAGLNRALQVAGAHNTITSLWKVSDAGTAEFFVALYEGLWTRKLTLVSAFEAARDVVIAKGYGPEVWSGFVLYVSGRLPE